MRLLTAGRGPVPRPSRRQTRLARKSCSIRATFYPTDAQIMNEMDHLIVRKGVFSEIIDNMRSIDLVNLNYFRDRFPAVWAAWRTSRGGGEGEWRVHRPHATARCPNPCSGGGVCSSWTQINVRRRTATASLNTTLEDAAAGRKPRKSKAAADGEQERSRLPFSTFGFSTPDAVASGVPQSTLIRMYGDREDDANFAVERQQRRMQIWRKRGDRVRQRLAPRAHSGGMQWRASHMTDAACKTHTDRGGGGGGAPGAPPPPRGAPAARGSVIGGRDQPVGPIGAGERRCAPRARGCQARAGSSCGGA